MIYTETPTFPACNGMSLSISRKYRPKTLNDLVGQETNVEILKNAAKENKIGQAYLFYGSRGTGKTTTARLVAKLLNCKTRNEDPKFKKLGEPCNDCLACKEIDSLSSFDVIEIDAASNRGIDEIRNLKESISVAPAGGPYKVYIIDEAHMLTTPAFNALLKTLEEPPRHAVLILATTEFEKLPATITSRTQRFLFKKVPKKQIMSKLADIAKEEKLEIEEDAIELVAASAEGSLRDAESLLDQLAAGGKEINLARAERLTGRTSMEKIKILAESILSKNIKGGLSLISDFNSEGHNLVTLTKELIHYLRRLLTLQTNPDLEPLMSHDLTDHELQELKSLIKLMPAEEVAGVMRNLIRAYSEMRYSPFATIPLEIALVELSSKNTEAPRGGFSS